MWLDNANWVSSFSGSLSVADPGIAVHTQLVFTCFGGRHEDYEFKKSLIKALIVQVAAACFDAVALRNNEAEEFSRPEITDIS